MDKVKNLNHATVRAFFTDIPDRELSCVGFWMEDMKSYMITYDEEDAVSAYRCWVSTFVNVGLVAINVTDNYNQ